MSDVFGATTDEEVATFLQTAETKDLLRYAMKKFFHSHDVEDEELEKVVRRCVERGNLEARSFLASLLFTRARLARRTRSGLTRTRSVWDAAQDRAEAMYILYGLIEKGFKPARPACLRHDPDGTWGRRFILHILLHGDCDINRHTPLFQSFFHSPIRETHLLSFIASFLIPRSSSTRQLDVLYSAELKEEEEAVHSDLIPVRWTRAYSSSCMKVRSTSGKWVRFDSVPQVLNSVFLPPSTFNEVHLNTPTVIGFLPLLDTSEMEVFHSRLEGKFTALTSTDLSSLRILDLSGARLGSISFLRSLKAPVLEELILDSALFEDLSPIADLNIPTLRVISLKKTFKETPLWLKEKVPEVRS